jgi:exodeoxyribonuclease VII large subunit
MSKVPTFSIEQLYQKVSSTLTDRLSLFQGMTLANISIDKELKPHPKWQYSYYTGTTKEAEKNYSINLKISNQLILQFRNQIGNEIVTNASYDILIENLSISSFGQISITVKAIKETGISERELLKRRLKKYCENQGYFKREKKELPRLVTSILALTSQYSEIHDDIHSNLNFGQDKVTIINCKNTQEIAKHIKGIKPNKYDIIVLYRGGREDEAMNMFSSEEIIEAIVTSPITVCAALGHDIDTPFIYTIADQTYSTPSSFGKAITAHNDETKKDYKKLLIDIKTTLERVKEKAEYLYTKDIDQIEATSKRLYEKVNAKIDKLLQEVENSVIRVTDSKHNKISITSNKIEHLVDNVYKVKADQISSIETAINYYWRDTYKNKLNHIHTLSINIEDYVKNIETNIQTKEELSEEKKSNKKTIVIFTAIIIALVSIIALLIFSN